MDVAVVEESHFANASRVALPLFAAAAAVPLADDAPARAMQLVTMLREFRGGAHLLAVVACGLEPRTAHYLSRPDVFFNFGWTESDIPDITSGDRSRLRAVGDLTDQLMLPAFSALDSTKAHALTRGLEAMRLAIPDPP